MAAVLVHPRYPCIEDRFLGPAGGCQELQLRRMLGIALFKKLVGSTVDDSLSVMGRSRRRGSA